MWEGRIGTLGKDAAKIGLHQLVLHVRNVAWC